MPLECSVCAHPDVFAINEHLVGIDGRPSNRRIAAQYGVTEQAIRRHKQHIPQLLVKASEAMEVAHAEDLLSQVRSLQDRSLSILDKAEAAEDLKTALSAISQARGNLELLAKLQGELDERPVVNLTLNPEWLELRAVIVQALEPYSDARESVLRALGGASNG